MSSFLFPWLKKFGFNETKDFFSERVIKRVLGRGRSHTEIVPNNTGVTFLDFDEIVIPIFQSSHWTLAYFNLVEKRGYYLDSVGGQSVDILRFLGRELFGKGCIHYLRDDLEFEYVCINKNLQTNASDCGPYTLFNSHMISVGDYTEVTPTFITNYRRFLFSKLLFATREKGEIDIKEI